MKLVDRWQLVDRQRFVTENGVCQVIFLNLAVARQAALVHTADGPTLNEVHLIKAL